MSLKNHHLGDENGALKRKKSLPLPSPRSHKMQVSTLISYLRSRHTILIQEKARGPEAHPSHMATTVPATQLEDLFQTRMLVGLAGPGEELRLGLAQVSPVHGGEQSSTPPRT